MTAVQVLTLDYEIDEDTEVQPNQPEVEAVPLEAPQEAPSEAEPGDEPGPEGEPPDEPEQAKAALRTAALIIKTATDEIESAETILGIEAAANQAWARDLTRDAWLTANNGRHCSTWDAIMKQVGLPGRPRPISFRVSGTAKVGITPSMMVTALKNNAGIEFTPDAYKAFEKAFKGVEFEGENRVHRNTIEVTPDPPDDPFHPTTDCMCPKVRRGFVDYVVQFVDRAAKFDEVVVETPNSCPAKEHLAGIAPKGGKTKGIPDDPF